MSFSNNLKTQLVQQLQQLPWQTHTVSLLLDGVNVKNLLHRFYTQHNQTKFEVLYLQTPFAELYEVSPCLIKLDNPTNPHLAEFLNNLPNEWGYILISDAPWEQQIKHLRDLLVVKMPDDQQVILKIADPIVADVLFNLSTQQGNTKLFGVFNQILTTNILNHQVNLYQRPDKNIVPLETTYKLTQEENTALDDLETKRSNHKLYQHMQQHFPTFLAHYPEESRKQAINYIIEEAEEQGYTTPMEQGYYLNIHGYLGDEALQNHPQILTLTKERTLESIRKAALLAEQIATQPTSN